MNDKDFDKQFSTTKTLVKDMVREAKILKIDPRILYFIMSETTTSIKKAMDKVYGKEQNKVE